jgi:AcrR family transcriptional regulator
MATLVKSKVGGNNRLQEISTVAARLFRQKGYAETTTKEIARACNISVGTLYYYIRSKKDFIKIFIDIHMSDIEKEIRAETSYHISGKSFETGGE